VFARHAVRDLANPRSAEEIALPPYGCLQYGLTPHTSPAFEILPGLLRPAAATSQDNAEIRTYSGTMVVPPTNADVRFRRRPDMATGTVKFFNSQKGFGFIQPSDGAPDVFVHVSAVERAGMSGLVEGQKVSYDVITERGKKAASNLQAA